MTEDRGDKYQFDEPYTTIDNVYGYGSGKDGDRYVSHICESCMQEFYASFKIPPQVVEIVVWGETPPDPIVLDPAQEPDS